MMTRVQWMENKDGIAEYAKFRASPIGRLEMDVLLTECSRLTVPAADHTGRVQVENASFALGFFAGRRWILDCMASMTDVSTHEEPKVEFRDPFATDEKEGGQ